MFDSAHSAGDGVVWLFWLKSWWTWHPPNLSAESQQDVTSTRTQWQSDVTETWHSIWTPWLTAPHIPEHCSSTYHFCSSVCAICTSSVQCLCGLKQPLRFAGRWFTLRKHEYLKMWSTTLQFYFLAPGEIWVFQVCWNRHLGLCAAFRTTCKHLSACSLLYSAGSCTCPGAADNTD